MDALFKTEFTDSSDLLPPTPTGDGQEITSDIDASKVGHVGEALLRPIIKESIESLSAVFGPISNVTVEANVWYSHDDVQH